MITPYGPALTTNISVNEAELKQHAPFCSGDERSHRGVREAFPVQKGDAGNFASALQLEVSQPVEWGDAQRSVCAVWSFQPVSGSDGDHCTATVMGQYLRITLTSGQTALETSQVGSHLSKEQRIKITKSNCCRAKIKAWI